MNDKMREALRDLEFLRLMANEALADNAAIRSAYERIKIALSRQPESEPVAEVCYVGEDRTDIAVLKHKTIPAGTKLYAGTQPSAQVPEEILEIGRRILADARDNDHYTAEPLFVVERRNDIYGIDTAYTDKIAWLDEDGDPVDAAEAAELEGAYKECLDVPDGYTRTGTEERWDYVDTYLTQQAAEARINGGPCGRVMVESAYRNSEMQAVRKFLMSLAAAPSIAQPSAQVPDVDALAREIRRVDGNHTLGAGALAEKIVAWLSAAPSIAVKETTMDKMREVVDFLLGAGELDGEWFVDNVKRGPFWWRKYLRQAWQEALSQQPESERVKFSDQDAARVARAFWRRIHPYIYESNEPSYPKEFGDKLPIEFQAHMATALCALPEIYTSPQPSAQVPDTMVWQEPDGDPRCERHYNGYIIGWNNCREAMLAKSSSIAEKMGEE